MPDEDNDWRRRFTAQDIGEEEDDRPRRTPSADRDLPQESAAYPAAVTVVVDEQGVVSDVVIASSGVMWWHRAILAGCCSRR